MSFIEGLEKHAGIEEQQEKETDQLMISQMGDVAKDLGWDQSIAAQDGSVSVCKFLLCSKAFENQMNIDQGSYSDSDDLGDEDEPDQVAPSSTS